MMLTIPAQCLSTDVKVDGRYGVALGRGYALDNGDVVQLVDIGPIEPVDEANLLEVVQRLEQKGSLQNSTELYRDRSGQIEPVAPVLYVDDSTSHEKIVSTLLTNFETVCVVPIREDISTIEDGITVYHSEDGNTEVGSVDIIRYQENVFDRLEGLIDTDYLANKTVTVVGLGTGGSRCAVELAKSGVGEFRLIDFDRLETHNITRHICGLSDIGRRKTAAVADMINEKNPAATVSQHNLNVVDEPADTREAIAGSDIVVVGTDTELSKLRTNEICLDLEIPAVYAGAYERGFGGDVVRVIPGETACYDCVLGELQSELDYSGSTGNVDYSENEDPTEVSAEPGLSTDVGFLALLQTKYVLATLLRNTESGHEEYEQNMLFWGTRPEWIFKQPFQSQFAETTIRDDCETCQRESYYESEVGMSEEEARTEVDEIISDADPLDEEIEE